jgi:hypothetical protein
MTTDFKAAIDRLRKHNQWRRGNLTLNMCDPKQLGEDIDLLCNLADSLLGEPSDEMLDAAQNLEWLYQTLFHQWKAMRDQLLKECG